MAATVNGTARADEIFGNNNASIVINGLGGNDRIISQDRGDTVYGGSGHDLVYGMSGNDIIFGEAGNDVLFGGADDDFLDGGNGNDHLIGEDGDDYLDGGSGHDILNGDAGNDVIKGGAGNDIMRGGIGQNFIDGGTGKNTVSYEFNSNDYAVNIRLSNGATDIYKGANRELVGHDTVVNVSNIFGSTGNDNLEGNSEANLIVGGGGNDRLSGWLGNDTLKAGDGNDAISLGEGDLAYGGTGSDSYYAVFSKEGTAEVADFKSGEDDLYIHRIVATSYSVTEVANGFRVSLLNREGEATGKEILLLGTSVLNADDIHLFGDF